MGLKEFWMNQLEVAQEISNEFLYKVINIYILEAPFTVEIHYSNGTSRTVNGKLAADIINAKDKEHG